jgi:hypothetical protein
MRYEEAKKIVEIFATQTQSGKIEYIDVDGPTGIYQRTSHVILENDGWKREIYYTDRLPEVVMSNVLRLARLLTKAFRNFCSGP